MEDRGWSQFDLSLESGLARGTIENCTCTKPRSCFARTLKTLAETFGVELAEIRAPGPPGAAPPGGTGGGEDRRPDGRPGKCKGRLLPEIRGARFIGRRDALARLTSAWTDPRERILSIVAVGGQGKTTLLKRWLQENPPKTPEAAASLVWSFDGQGREDGDAGAGSDAFLASVWSCLFAKRDLPKDWHRCAEQIAERLAEIPTLLVLDGIEVLQSGSAPTGGSGRLPASEPVGTLLRHLAEDNAGLCIVTSGCPLTDLEEYRGTSVPELRLGPFDRTHGIALLRALGVTLHDRGLGDLSEALWGHPLSLYLIGKYLAAGAEEIDPDRLHERYLCDADRETGGPCERILSDYETWLGDGPERDLLRLLSLFDAPVDPELLDALAKAPLIDGLNGSLTVLAHRPRELALSRLRELGLVDLSEGRGQVGLALHPVVRSHVRTGIEQRLPDAWRAVHARIYRWLLSRAPKEPVGFEDLEPLYRTLGHGLEAGLHSEVFDEVVWKRLLQGYPALALQKFNAGQRDLRAVGGFFEGDPPDPDCLRAGIDDPQRLGRLCWWAGLVLLLHGHYGEAIRFFDAAEGAFARAGDQLSIPMAQLYKRTCLLYRGLVNEALTLSRAAVDQLGSELCEIGKWARGSRYVMGTIAKVILQIGYQGGKTVPLHLRVGLFSLGEVLHAAGRLEEAREAFGSALQSPLPSGAREWDLFLVQDGWYLEYLLSAARYDRARSYINDHINTYEDSRLAESIAAIANARIRIDALTEPTEVESLASALEAMAEPLDLRTKPHLIRGLLELTARARALGDFELAQSLLTRARAAARAANIDLLEVDCLIEEGWIKLRWGELHAATQIQLQVLEIIEQTGYRLRLEDVVALGVAIGREGR